MFGLFGNKEEKRVADKIGVELHRQLYKAMEVNEDETRKNLASVFTTGYIIGFTRMGFVTSGLSGDRAEKYIKYICNGVMPKKLHRIFKTQISFLDMYAKSGEQHLKRDVDPFEVGLKAGYSDAEMFSGVNQCDDNFKKYLMNEELDYIDSFKDI